MGAKDHEAEIIAKLKAVPGYRQQFTAVFKGEPTVDNIMQAIASYERTIIAGNDATAFDRWQAGDQSAVGEEVKRGYEVFKKIKCDTCHAGVLLTDLQFHNVGVGMDAAEDKSAKCIEIGGKLIAEMKKHCQGVHLMAIGWENRIPAILDAARI